MLSTDFPKTELVDPSGETKKTIEYAGGTVSYSTFGLPNLEHNPLLIVSGFTEDSVSMQSLAEALKETGEREVIVVDQPRPKGRLSALNRHAEAYLAVLEHEHLGGRPVDVVMHSLGLIIGARMAELAKQRGITALDESKGSHSIAIAPAGSNKNENILFLGGRYLFKFLPQYMSEAKKFDPDRRLEKNATKNALRNPLKTLAEIGALSKRERIYKRLGESGIKPMILEYQDDQLMSGRANALTLKNYAGVRRGKVKSDKGRDYNLSGWATVVDFNLPESVNSEAARKARSRKEFRQATGLSKDVADDIWLDHWRRAGHNDHIYHPERAAKAVLQFLDGGITYADKGQQQRKIPLGQTKE